jgi:PleD family two-component response regulator
MLKKKNKKVLIVEDDKLLGKALGKILDDGGFETDIVMDGNRVFSKAKKFKPDLILLDLILPGMDGFAVLQKLKSTEDTKDIDVIVLSNLEKDTVGKKKILKEAIDYIVKSDVTLEDVLKIVRNNVSK